MHRVLLTCSFVFAVGGATRHIIVPPGRDLEPHQAACTLCPVSGTTNKNLWNIQVDEEVDLKVADKHKSTIALFPAFTPFGSSMFYRSTAYIVQIIYSTSYFSISLIADGPQRCHPVNNTVLFKEKSVVPVVTKDLPISSRFTPRYFIAMQVKHSQNSSTNNG